jgi:hypothetical protein
MRGMDVGRPAGERPAEKMKPADGIFAAPPRRFAMSRCKMSRRKGRWQNLADFRRLRNGLIAETGALPRWQRLGTICYYIVVPLVPSPMEDPMCWEIDYKFFAEQKKAQDARIKQEQRAGVIDRLLNQANEPAEKTEVEATPPKEVAPAK